MSGLYIHIPFCHAKCYYCDFFSMPTHDKVADLVDALICEWHARAEELPTSLNTVYIGGGTPSILPIEQFQRLIGAIQETQDVQEFTIEVNPEDVDGQRCDAWRRCGVNRVSMGVQTLDNQQLKNIGRRHTAAQAKAAAQTLARYFDNISLDLIYGLPGQDIDSWRNSLDEMLDLQPQHFSAYCLSYEPGTRLYAMLSAGKITETDDDSIAQMYEILTSTAVWRGYEHYEISNFAVPGYRSRHNSSYWTGTPYLGLGPGAHSFDGKIRRYNPSNLRKYLDAVKACGHAYEIDSEDDRDRLNDYIFTRLRTLEGIDPKRLTTPQLQRLLARANNIAPSDLVISDNAIYIPEKQWLRSDAIIRELLEVD